MSDRAATELAIRGHHERGELDRAAEEALRGYGGEIFGFLHAFHRSDEDAAEVFSIFTERLWKGLPAFRWDCSFRTWAYSIARNAARNYREHRGVRRRFEVALPEGSRLSELAEQIRSTTLTYLRTETKDRIAKLRASLTEEDRMLLTLRLDRELAWEELARVLNDDEDDALSDDAIKRESARLRKRFQSIKEKMSKLARKEGLLPKN